MKTIHYVQLALGVVAGAAASFATAVPQYAPYANALGAVAASLLGALSLVSPAVVPVPPAAPKP